MKQDIKTLFYSKKVMAKIQVEKRVMKTASDGRESQMEKLKRDEGCVQHVFFFSFLFARNKREQKSREKK